MATARAVLRVAPSTIGLLRSGQLPKGDPLPVARIAAIQAAKKTSDLIPFCHPVDIEHADCRFDVQADTVEITATVTAVHKTGVEMEALTAASVAALTIYDMVKMVDDAAEILTVRLLEKKGGKSDHRKPLSRPVRAGVLIVSDSVVAGTRIDESGKRLGARLAEQGVDVVAVEAIADERATIESTLKNWADENRFDIICTTGGTGLGPRDVTPEATLAVLDREVPGVAEAIRQYGQNRMPTAMLSRAVAGLRGNTLIVNLPGSVSGVNDGLDALLPGILHAFAMIDGGGH
jgi:molybdenum cofactor biosynthesis protein MoaC